MDFASLLSFPTDLCTIADVVSNRVKNIASSTRISGANIAGGEHVLFFDDVISEGLSKLEGVNALEQLGVKVEHILVVDREQGGPLTLEKAGYKVHAIAKISGIVESLLNSKHVTMAQAEAVLNYVRH